MAKQDSINKVTEMLQESGSTILNDNVVVDVAKTEKDGIAYLVVSKSNKVIPTVAKYPVTSMVRRCLNTLNLDNENIKLTADEQKDYILYGDSEQGILGRALTDEEQDAYDEALDIYEEKKQILERIGKGDLPLPEEKHYPALDLNEPAYTELATAFFYAPSWFLREMKHMLRASLRLEAHPHGKRTKEIGILQFSVPNVTRLEAQKIAANYKDMIVSFYYPDPRPVGRNGRVINGSKRVQPLAAVKGATPTEKPSIVIKEAEKATTENKSQVTTRKATQAEIDLAKKIKEEANNQ